MSRNKNDRILRRKLLHFLKKIHIKSWGFSFEEISLSIWIMLIVISFFLPWFSIPDTSISNGAFSPIIWVNGYVLGSFCCIILFTLFSQKIKQKVKLFLNHSIKNSHIYIVSSIFIVLSILNSIVILNWLYIFVSKISFNGWITVALVWSIVMFVSSLFLQMKQTWQEYLFHKDLKSKDSYKETPKNIDKITKLPF